jgi:hypothetical protein
MWETGAALVPFYPAGRCCRVDAGELAAAWRFVRALPRATWHARSPRPAVLHAALGGPPSGQLGVARRTY